MSKKILRALLYPPFPLLLLLLPVAVVALVLAMTRTASDSPLAIGAYVLSAYTLTVWCVRVPELHSLVRKFRTENPYYLRWRSDEKLRVTVSLSFSLATSVLFAVFQLGLGIVHRTFWFTSFAVYYALLALMRYWLFRYTRTHEMGADRRSELVRYRASGVVLLMMNLALALIVFFMVYWNRTFHHHEITTIAMAAYTFTTFTLAIVDIFKYRKYDSPVYSATKCVGLAAATVSVLTLESTMLTTFGREDPVFSRVMLSVTGFAVVAFIVTMAICMICQSTRAIARIQAENEKHKGEPPNADPSRSE